MMNISFNSDDEDNPIHVALKKFLIDSQIQDLKEEGKFEEAEQLALKKADLDLSAIEKKQLASGSNDENYTPDTLPEQCVSTTFDRYAEDFDQHLTKQLNYAVPEIILEKISKFTDARFNRLLDLGCGTGLCAEAIGDRVMHKTGVDLSEGMLIQADQKELYDDLYLKDLNEFLQVDWDDRWDLIISGDTLVYLGALEDAVAGLAKNIEPNGKVIFTTETAADEAFTEKPYVMGSRGRFAHSALYLRELLEASGFTLIEIEEVTPRFENGEPVQGLVVVAEYKGV
ncbi:methyltransferase protein [Pseudovibrio sp. FO-BEG1]|uniref:class I SAM-dependent DNA methyltransferase n=1 Tax=Pseudovibrio sp. (strain FO-BEG1) TaxID=911045 RepID=UPI000238C42C|nr:methyltransferase domain-containing protein [Pseudovibrio sp. FO-BEG1]AEV37770.1 methyltransferase protein [Pseudovibrio sp. FO-BEG1]